MINNNQFPAFEELKNRLEREPVVMATTVKGYQKLLAEFTRLREAVVILPDDAEPEVGDIILVGDNEFCEVMKCGKGLYVESFEYDKKTKTKITWVKYAYRITPVQKIIQRNGRPVIYESQIKPAEDSK